MRMKETKQAWTKAAISVVQVLLTMVMDSGPEPN